jgi:hypothetical protein
MYINIIHNNMVTMERRLKPQVLRDDEKEKQQKMADERTSIQLTPSTRDRLYRLKFRRTYDQFINELCDLYEREESRMN